MTFGGRPLNNFVVQAWAEMVGRACADSGAATVP